MKLSRRLLTTAFAILFLLTPLTAQTKGPLVDKVLFNAKSQEDLGLMDVATGKSDLWNYGTAGAVLDRLPADVKAKLEVYSVAGASAMGLMLNPFPNRAPYLSDAATDASGKVQFNPFAVQKIRFALNDLINRQTVVEEVLGGFGVPQYTPVTPTLPNSSRFDAVAAKLGLTATGNEARALADIQSALTEASALPELKGRLTKGNPWWTFDGQPVTLHFVIRADDPNARLPLGRYVADQLEKAGLKVERLEFDRTKASATVNKTDPRALQWSLYTEGLGSNETKAYWEMTMSYMYAPWASVMPGNNNPGWWNYQNAEIDRLTQTVVNGQIKNADEYWANLLAATNLGVKESVRVLVAAKTSSLVAAKDRFGARMAYGVGDGLDKWSLYTADVKPETSGADSGKKVLRMTGFSARGALFMNAWDPVGTQGFGDTYSGAIIKPVSDLELETNPATGIPMAVRATWANLKSPALPMSVPAAATTWDQAAGKWLPVAAKVTANSSATFTFRFGSWHHGRAVDQNDYRYALAFPYGITDPGYVSGVKARLDRNKGFVFEKDGSITVYSDARFPVDQAQLAALMVPTLQVGAVNSGAVLPWEILEAVKAVTEKSASGTVWSFATNGTSTEVDLLNPKLVADLKVQLKAYETAKYVPASLVGFVTPEQAVRDYQLTRAWLEEHGHGYISNGGFVLDQYEAANNTGVLTAFRDRSYPFESGSWVKALQTAYTRVDSISVADPTKGQSVKVTVAVSQVAYPSNTATPASSPQVTVSLMVGDKAVTVAAKATKVGTYEADLSAKVVDALASGAYVVVVESSLGKGDAPGVGSSLLLKF